jgi:hypothetical protein
MALKSEQGMSQVRRKFVILKEPEKTLKSRNRKQRLKGSSTGKTMISTKELIQRKKPKPPAYIREPADHWNRAMTAPKSKAHTPPGLPPPATERQNK